MPRNAQWTSQEDDELRNLALTNSKENNGTLDWDEIHDSSSGQIVRRSKNAMIARWWKIKEQHKDDEDDEDDAQDSETESTNTHQTDKSNDTTVRKRRKRRHKKRKKEADASTNSSNTNVESNPMHNIIHSILRSTDDKEDTTESDETLTEHSSVSYKNYYKHDIETLKLTSFDICQLQPYIRAFEDQVLMMSPDATSAVHATAAEIKKENGNLRRTIILQNKFLNELYTKIQHQQGIVREMVECCDKLKFKMKCMEDILNKQIMDKNKEMQQLLGSINNISNNHMNSNMMHFVNHLAQILQCQGNANANDMMNELKRKLFNILDKTEYAKNISTNKRKRDGLEELAAASPPRKKQKQLALPTINANNMNNNSVQPVLFTPSMTAEYQRILPPALSAHVPPPLPTQTHNQNAQKNKYGIDLLLKVAMLDHQNK